MARGDRRDWRWNDVPLRGPAAGAADQGRASCPRCRAARRIPRRPPRCARPASTCKAAGYVVEEVLPPDMERGVELWHMICVTDVFGGLWPQMQKMGDPDGIASMKGWLDTAQAGRSADLRRRAGRARGPAAALDDLLPAMAAGDPADARRPAARQVADIDRAARTKILESMRPALLAPLLGLPGLAVPVGSHGKLRTGVQIMADAQPRGSLPRCRRGDRGGRGRGDADDRHPAALAARRQVDPGVAQLLLQHRDAGRGVAVLALRDGDAAVDGAGVGALRVDLDHVALKLLDQRAAIGRVVRLEPAPQMKWIPRAASEAIEPSSTCVPPEGDAQDTPAAAFRIFSARLLDRSPAWPTIRRGRVHREPAEAP